MPIVVDACAFVLVAVKRFRKLKAEVHKRVHDAIFVAKCALGRVAVHADAHFFKVVTNAVYHNRKIALAIHLK